MEDFIQIVEGDVVLEKVNLTRATMKEAIAFKKILQSDFEKKFNKIIVDISQCEFVDSTFLGVMVFALREMNKINGQLRIIQPTQPFRAFLERTMILESFSPKNSLIEAMESFN